MSKEEQIQRMKGQIRSLARGNAVDLMELGKTIYDRYKAGGEVGEEAAGRCDAIKDREAAIGEYEKKIAKIKGASECSNCGKMVGKDMAFCPYCGEKVISDAEEESDDPSDDYASQVREKMADAAEKVAGKADEAARKVGDMAEKAAAKTGDIAEKAAEKINDAAEKVSDKLNEK